MKKIIAWLGVVCVVSLCGCEMNDVNQTTSPIVEPLFATLLERDSIATGSYLDVGVQDAAHIAYEKIQAFNQVKRFDYLSLVSSTVTEVSQLKGRLHLYTYLVLDERKGTDSGIQLTMENGLVKSIYSNGGKSLQQWPEKAGLRYSIRPGDGTDSLYEKLLVISQEKSYKDKFQRISLLTKSILTAFDPTMADLPMWYFVNKTGDHTWEVVEVYFENQNVKYFIVRRYRN